LKQNEKQNCFIRKNRLDVFCISLTIFLYTVKRVSRSPATGQAGLFAGGIKPAENIFSKYRIMILHTYNPIFLAAKNALKRTR